MNFNDINTALKRVTDILQETNPYAVEHYIDILELTSGVDSNGTTHYRVYYVVAWQLWLGLENNLLKGEGAVFNENKETTRRYLTMQSMIDENSDLLIPGAFQVEGLLDKLNATVVENDKPSVGFLSF